MRIHSIVNLANNVQLNRELDVLLRNSSQFLVRRQQSDGSRKYLCDIVRQLQNQWPGVMACR